MMWAWVSKALGPRNQTLSVYENEYLAILLAVEHWRQYLQLSDFIIQTDERSLASLTDHRLHISWQQKALTKLLGLQYTISYKKGSENRGAEALSRMPHSVSETLPELHAISSTQPVWLDDIVASYTMIPLLLNCCNDWPLLLRLTLNFLSKLVYSELTVASGLELIQLCTRK